MGRASEGLESVEKTSEEMRPHMKNGKRQQIKKNGCVKRVDVMVMMVTVMGDVRTGSCNKSFNIFFFFFLFFLLVHCLAIFRCDSNTIFRISVMFH